MYTDLLGVSQFWHGSVSDYFISFCYNFSACVFVLCVTPVCGAALMPSPRDGASHVAVLIVFKKYGLEMNGAKISNYKIK